MLLIILVISYCCVGRAGFSKLFTTVD